MSLGAPPALFTPKQPIAIRPECISTEHTSIHVRQKAAWSHGNFISRKADGTIILTSEGKVLSNSARKEFLDGSGLPLFSLRKAWLSLTRHYWLELPGGQDVLTIRQRFSFGKVKLDFTVRNVASPDHEDVLLEVRGDDWQNAVTDVLCNGHKVAVIRRKFNENTISYKFLPEYDVDVAEGMDYALVKILSSSMNLVRLMIIICKGFSHSHRIGRAYSEPLGHSSC